MGKGVGVTLMLFGGLLALSGLVIVGAATYRWTLGSMATGGVDPLVLGLVAAVNLGMGVPVLLTGRSMFRGARPDAVTIHRDPRSRRSRTGDFVARALVVGLGISAAALIVACSVLVAREFRRVVLTRGYAETQGRVTTSELSSRRKHLLFVARFVVRGQEYTVTGSNLDTPAGIAKDRVVARYPVGSSVSVYFDPDDPTDAMLSHELASGVAPIIAVVMTSAALPIVLRRRKRRD